MPNSNVEDTCCTLRFVGTLNRPVYCSSIGTSDISIRSVGPSVTVYVHVWLG